MPVRYEHCSWPKNSIPAMSCPPRASRVGHEYEHDGRYAGAASAVEARARTAILERIAKECGWGRCASTGLFSGPQSSL
jgi:hypothetical protein